MQNCINGIELNRLFVAGYNNLVKNMETVNNLNVFPVPDGDTGTNMVHTFGGGLKYVGDDIADASDYMTKLAEGVLLSARGNSGVILSQFIHGLHRGFANKHEITINDFGYAFSCAKEDSYKAIITPTEGTILTVISEAEKYLNSTTFEGFDDGFEGLVNNIKNTLAKTPDLLPVLKEAGVVDSGGAGLLCFIEGIYSSICGQVIDEPADFTHLADASSGVVLNHNFGPDSKLEYGYCTEFILQLMNYKTDIESFSKDEFVKTLEHMGDSIVAVLNGSIVKIHIHTFTPEKVLEYARRFGEFLTLKIENMSVQHSEVQAGKPKEKVKYCIITVASGKGIVDYFYGIGASVVVEGGQTENPSVEDFIKAFDKFDAEHYVVLPNNSNIILTAEQAAKMYDKDVRIIPTKSIVEGYSALSMMNLWSDTVEELISDMSSGLSNVISASVTTATRDACIDGVQITKDNYIGIANKEILVCGKDRDDVALQLIKTVNDKNERDVIIVFFGENVSENEAAELKAQLEERYPLMDIGFIEGNQKVYDYIISLE